MARQSSGKGSASQSDAPLDEAVEVEDSVVADVVDDDTDVDDVDGDTDVDDIELDDAEVAAAAETPIRDAATDAFWSEVRMQPVEIALPGKNNVGVTLRAYRLSTEITPTEVELEEDEFEALRRRDDPVLDDEDEIPPISDEELAREALAAADPETGRRDRDRLDVISDDDEAKTDGESVEDDPTAESDTDADDDDKDEDKADVEEVPVFLSDRGKVFVFRSAEGLVDFVRSDAEHDLLQLDTWAELREKISAAHVVPLAEDRYELDLVVENLRGGPDVWDVDLLIQAGEVARDVAFALRIPTVLTALAPGSPLDDLDEALRSTAKGGVGGFFARRKLRKIGAQQAALGWRTIIGKISAAADWRD